MSRARTLKPEWLDDELLADCSSDARVLSIGLICLADDYGNGRAGRKVLSGKVFAGKPIEVLDEALKELVKIQYVLLYEVDGQAYFSIRTWDKHQRVDRPGLPKVPGPNLSIDGNKPAEKPFEGVPQEIPGNPAGLPEVPEKSPTTRASSSRSGFGNSDSGSGDQKPLVLLANLEKPKQVPAGARGKTDAAPAKSPLIPFEMHDAWQPAAELVAALAGKFSVAESRVRAEIPEFKFYWKQRRDRKKAHGWDRTFSNNIERLAQKGSLFVDSTSRPAPTGQHPYQRGSGPKQPNSGFRADVESDPS